MKTRMLGVMAAVIGLSAAPVAAMAEDAAPAPESWIPGTFTGNVALTSDYVFRGISQTNNNVAIQGGMDWDTGAGFHIGTWGSSLNFKDGGEASAEIDLYGGYAGKLLDDKLSYDVGFIYYWYPGAAHTLDYDLWEVYVKAGYDFGIFALNASVNYTPDNSGGTNQDATYISGGVTVPITDTLSISGAIDHYWRKPFTNYTDWNIGAKLMVNNWFAIDVRYYDTDIKGDCASPVTKKLCKAKAVATLSRSF